MSSGATSFAQILENRPARQPMTRDSLNVMLEAHARAKSQGTYSEIYQEYGGKTTSDAYADSTWSNYGTAAGHWSRFAKAKGLESEIIWLDESNPADRAEIKLLFQEFLAWLAMEIKALEGPGLAEVGTISGYASSIVKLHRMLGVQLSFAADTIKEFSKGRAKHLVDIRGPKMKRKKNGFTLDQFADWETVDWSPMLGTRDPSRRKTVLRALYQCSFACEWRRSDATLKKGEWRQYWNISRANVRWFDDQMNEMAPTPANLLHLYNTRAGYASVRSPPGKNDQAGDGATARFPSLLPLASPGQFCPGMSLLRLEIEDPCWSETEPLLRATQPLFVDPESRTNQSPRGTAFRTNHFDKFIKWIFRTSLMTCHGTVKSEAQISKEYSLHSFRIGGCCALRTIGSPKHIRMFAGRWLSEAMGEYDREETREMLYYMFHKQQGYCKLSTGQPEDLPMYPEERAMQGAGKYVRGATSIRAGLAVPESWNTPGKKVQELVGQRIKIMMDNLKGTTYQNRQGERVVLQRPCFCEIYNIAPGEMKPIKVQFQDHRRPRAEYSFLEWAHLSVRTQVPGTNNYVEVPGGCAGGE